MGWKSTTIPVKSSSPYITNIRESTDRTTLLIEVKSNLAILTNDVSENPDYDNPRVYEIYRYGKTATSSAESSTAGRLGTTPIYAEGAMWIED